MLFSFETVSILSSVSSAIKKRPNLPVHYIWTTTGLLYSTYAIPNNCSDTFAARVATNVSRKKKPLTIWKTTNPKLRREIILWRILMFRSVIVLFTKCSKLNACVTPSMHDSTTSTKKVVLSQYVSLSRRLHKLLGHLVKIYWPLSFEVF